MRPRDAPLLPSKEEAGTPGGGHHRRAAPAGGKEGAKPRVTEHEVGLNLFILFIGFTPGRNKRSPSYSRAFKAVFRADFYHVSPTQSKS